jgi:hypothetical protein
MFFNNDDGNSYMFPAAKSHGLERFANSSPVCCGNDISKTIPIRDELF